ncbi:MAG TPA: type II toxin-antitoxin system VapB family antitoxin [Bryobacteraceae bacterium]|nr:type II toxin-antitoxin system VapB family antitoxin [Bryobacteraceae bacterium]
MTITKVFRSGNSQAVRIPRQFKLKSDEVEIFRRGDEIVMRERRNSLAEVVEILAGMPKDFFRAGRKQGRMQKRKGL